LIFVCYPGIPPVGKSFVRLNIGIWFHLEVLLLLFPFILVFLLLVLSPLVCVIVCVDDGCGCS
jgi:hypothetical protein